MNKLLLFTLAGLASASFAAPPIAAPHEDTIAYKQMADKASTDYKAAKALCDGQRGPAKDECAQQAKLSRARAEADAVAQYKNDKKSLEKAQINVAEAEYDLAKTRCAALTGNDKSNCMNTAKSTETAAIADAKAEKATANLAQRSGEDCNAMGGADKAACLTRSQSGMAGEAVADSVITTKVKAELLKEPNLKSLDVHVETNQGVVNLSGFVPSQVEVDKAIDVARNVQGVNKVQNALRIK